jgi:hypothetical protein
LLLGFGLTHITANAQESAAAPVPAVAAAPTPQTPIEEALAQLLRIRRLHVQDLNGGEAASQIRDMIIAALQSAGLFAVTENPERADAFLKGTAEDLVFNDQFSSSDSIGFRTAGSLGRGGIVSQGAGRIAGSSGVTADEDVRIQERKHEAVAAVRIVNKDGDVIWSTTQESLGAKFRGASADVADKITRQLRADMERARKLPTNAAKRE